MYNYLNLGRQEGVKGDIEQNIVDKIVSFQLMNYKNKEESQKGNLLIKITIFLK